MESYRPLALLLLGGLFVWGSEACEQETDPPGGGGGGQGGTSGATGGNAGSAAGGSGTGGSAELDGGLSDVHRADPDGGLLCNGKSPDRVTFRLTSMDAFNNYCVPLCASRWLTVMPEGRPGAPVEFIQPQCTGECSTTATCNVPLASSTYTYEWDGEVSTVFCDGGIVNEDADNAGIHEGGTGVCVRGNVCLAPGRYVAHMCADKMPADAGTRCEWWWGGTPTCVDVPFDYPPTGPVEGVIR